MRASIPHPLRERIPRHLRERRHLRTARNMPEPGSGPARPSSCGPSDLAVERVRDAGGPVDKASYSCQCGCVFIAPVSTTVTCPHCHAAQTW